MYEMTYFLATGDSSAADAGVLLLGLLLCGTVLTILLIVWIIRRIFRVNEQVEYQRQIAEYRSRNTGEPSPGPDSIHTPPPEPKKTVKVSNILIYLFIIMFLLLIGLMCPSSSIPNRSGPPVTNPVEILPQEFPGHLNLYGPELSTVSRDSPDSALGFFGLCLAVVGLLVFIWAKRTMAKKSRVNRLRAKYGDQEIVDRILQKTIWVGETSDQLRDSLGPPVDTDEKVLKTKKKVVWKYAHRGGNRYALRITLENDIVVGWDERL